MKVRGERAFASLAGVLLLAGGCAAPQEAGASAAPAAPRGWFAARGHDLARSFDLALSIGPGLGARVAVTRHFQAGLLMIDATNPAPRNLTPVNVTVGVREGEVGSWSIRSLEYGLSPWYHADALVRRLESEEVTQRIDPSATRDARLSAQLHLALVGAEFAFDPLAFGQFLAGLFGFGEAGFFDESPPAPAAPPH